MAWIGKIAGGLLGYAAARLMGAVAGVILGHQFDRGMAGTARVRRDSGPAGSEMAQGAALDQAYAVLGVARNASDREVKTAYRRLMNQHHPDKQAARGLPDSMLEIAKERTAEIRAAYDAIKAQRGLK